MTWHSRIRGQLGLRRCFVFTRLMPEVKFLTLIFTIPSIRLTLLECPYVYSFVPYDWWYCSVQYYLQEFCWSHGGSKFPLSPNSHDLQDVLRAKTWRNIPESRKKLKHQWQFTLNNGCGNDSIVFRDEFIKVPVNDIRTICVWMQFLSSQCHESVNRANYV